MIVLEDRKVQLGDAGTDQRIAAQISPFVYAGEGQTLRLDIMVGISRISKRAAAWRRQEVRKLTILIEFRAGRLTAQDWKGWPELAL